MLVVEGPDGSGKTTLAKKISEEFGIEYRRAPTLSSTDGADYSVYQWFREEINANDTAVYDRCFAVSELIYQLATPHRKLIITPKGMRDMMTDMWIKQVHWIFCLPAWEVSKPIIQSQPEKLRGVDENQLEKIHWAYSQIGNLIDLANPAGLVYKYDFTASPEWDTHERFVMGWVNDHYMGARTK